jgi:hypothetical protein
MSNYTGVMSSFVGLEDSVVISRGELHIVPCGNCELIPSEHDGRSTACDEYEPDVRAAEARYVEENEWSISAEAVARKIGMSLDQWEGNCAGVACLLLEHNIGALPEGTVDVHGMWLGPISNRSTHFGGRTASQHHWLVLPDGWIIDPTRWCFEGVRPYIFYGMDEDDYYDEGANRFNEIMRGEYRAFPDYSTDGVVIDFGEATDLVSRLVGIPFDLWDFPRAAWLANMSYDRLDGKAKIIYDALTAADFEALIPYDNRLRADQGR